MVRLEARASDGRIIHDLSFDGVEYSGVADYPSMARRVLRDYRNSGGRLDVQSCHFLEGGASLGGCFLGARETSSQDEEAAGAARQRP
jgi:hypothetical protein